MRGACCEKTGTFTIDLKAYETSLYLSPNTQPDCLRNLKKHIVRHIVKSETHLKNIALKKEIEKLSAEKESRNYKIGLNLSRIRYNDIKQLFEL